MPPTRIVVGLLENTMGVGTVHTGRDGSGSCTGFEELDGTERGAARSVEGVAAVVGDIALGEDLRRSSERGGGGGRALYESIVHRRAIHGRGKLTLIPGSASFPDYRAQEGVSRRGRTSRDKRGHDDSVLGQSNTAGEGDVDW